MADQDRMSTQYPADSESTLRDIWQASQRSGARFDPQVAEKELDYRKEIRKNIRTMDRYSFDKLEDMDSPQVRKPEITKQMQRRSTTINLEKSIQLLDDAVGTPSILRSTKHRTPMSLTHSTYRPQELPSGSMFDVSASLGLTPGKSLLSTTGQSRSGFGEIGMDSTHPAGRTSVFENLADIIDDDATTTNVALLLEEDPAMAACTGMFSEFMQAMKNNRSEHQVFQLLADYESICQKNAALLKKLLKRTKPGQSKLVRTGDMLEAVRQERNTWRLLTSLYRDRLETEMKSEEEPMMVDSLGKHQSEKDVIDALYEKDATIRQHQLVVDWLEKNGEDLLEDIYDRVDFFTDKTGAWENTLHTLMEQRMGGAKHSDRPMVDRLDPDAVVRQGRPLQDLDREDESRLLRYLFGLIRAGQIDKAQQLCIKVGQSWRAATLEGWRPYHDPNFDDQLHGTEREKVQGNPYRDVWKKTCWSLADDERLDIHERAIYAAYSGNLAQLLPICTKWEDQLWAYFRCCVDRRVEQEVRMTHNLNRPWEELPQTYLDKILTAEAIFQEIQASSNDDVKKQGKGRFETIQKYIILGDVDTLIEEMYEWCKDEAHRPSQHLVRFMSHVILFFRAIGLSSKEELCVAILETYVKTLIESQQSQPVAVYTATLPQELQVQCYAKFLEGIKQTQERKHCLELGEEVGLDMSAITQHVVENVRRRDTTEMNMDNELPLEGTTSQEDREKIEALDWLVFNISQRAEAIKQANAMMRAFLGRRKLTAAREAFHKLPPDSIDVVFQIWHKQTGSEELSAVDANAVREYLCVQAYLDAQDSFNDWFKHYHNSKPVKPDVPVGSNFTENVAYEHKMREYEQELERWQHSLDLQSKTTAEKIYNVLLFVDGGWMVDQRQDGPRDDARSHQMRLLRQLCIPPLCFLLHTVLHTTKQYSECMQLANIISSDHYKLFKVFRRDELQKLLQKLRESSIAMLDMGVDPLGFELS